MMPRFATALTLLGAVAIACSSHGTIVVGDVAHQDSQGLDVLTNDTETHFDIQVPDDLNALETGNLDFVGVETMDVGLELDAGQEPGGFLWPCDSGDDCLSGYCIESPSGKVCTVGCISECSGGWVCVQDQASLPDVIFICAPLHARLCLPCTDDAECNPPGLELDGRCLDMGDNGGWCGTNCTDDEGCLDGYSCIEQADLTGETSFVCVADTPCECSELAVAMEAWTYCSTATEAGTCTGTIQCSEPGPTLCNAPAAVAEICDGLDNDCDGFLDEELGETTCGNGNCQHTVDNCDAGEEVTCDPFEGAANELCNGLDDDCNGETDEDFLDSDGDGTPDCMTDDDDGDGVPDGPDNCPFDPNPEQEDNDYDTIGDLCDPDDDNDQVPDEADCAPLNKNAFPGAQEKCNGEDDNCNGELDEELGETTCGLGQCEHVVANCADGSLQSCDPLEGEGAEVCDGLDNDCDGDVDETFPDTDLDGQTDCVDLDDDGDGVADAEDNCLLIANQDQGNFDEDETGDACDEDDDGDGDLDAVDCAPLNPAISHLQQEACNDLDDNCNGQTDEAGAAGCKDLYADLDGDGYGTEGLGKCLCAPSEFYTAKEFGDCQPLNPDVSPGEVEQCNGLDDDCSGSTDEGFADLDDDGLADCIDADDDGDGKSDEIDNCPTIPNPLQDDNDGDQKGDVCDPDDDNDGTADGADCAPFDPSVHPDAEEICDDVNNDCDNETDEDQPSLSCGQGVCAHTSASCVDGVPTDCDPLAGAGEEICDGLDNDCNGEADEDQPTLSCGLGICAHITPSCVDGVPTDCDPLAGAGEEICDGLDNDCNGETDEELGSSSCGAGVCLHLVQNCIDGKPGLCDPGEGAEDEICDGLDNDCDGHIDEGFDEDDDGVTVCQNDCNDDDPLISPEQDEICYDLKDNNCDEAIDESCVPISNVPAANLSEGQAPLTITEGTVSVNTSTGEISGIREAGEGLVVGIYFKQVEQAGGGLVGLFAVTELTVSDGATLVLTGSLPGTILVSGDATVEGNIQLSGAKGSDANTSGPNPGGSGAAGSGDGGYGSNTSYAGATAGSGTGHGFLGIAGVHYGNGGGGAGYCAGGGGGMGDRPSVVGKPGTMGAGGAGGFNGGDGGKGGNGGGPYGSDALTPLIAGSGGAGGYSDTDHGPNGAGGGGGAGGGALQLSVAGSLAITETGNMTASGGPGGDAWGGGGGGGSGGSLLLEAATIDVAGSVLAHAGKGGDGCTPWNSGAGGFAGGVADGPLWGGGGAAQSGAGGGAAGRIRLNTLADGLTISGTILPALDSACTTSSP